MKSIEYTVTVHEAEVGGYWTEQQHLPDRLAGHRYYEPGALGYEAKIKEWWEALSGELDKS